MPDDGADDGSDDRPQVRMTGRGAAIVVGLLVAETVLFGVAERAPGDLAGTLGGLRWLVALLGVGMAAWLTRFQVVEAGE